MNIDCHYYGTYYLSRMAGFASEEALQIAWAAQTVDECHFERMNSLFELAAETNVLREFDEGFILTILASKDDIQHTLSINALHENSSEIDRIMLTGVRSVWMPFHFLPGNWRKAIKLSQMIHYNGDDVNFLNPQNSQFSQNMHDWGLMCRSSSQTCINMIQHAKKQYHEWKDVNNSRAFDAIGIAMHVLADTWSHEYFVGSPNRKINFALSDFSTPTLKQVSTGLLATLSFSDYTYDNIGHGPAGHGPDIPYLDKRYKLMHPFLSRCTEGTRYIVRNNQDRFLSGFAQMLISLRYIKSEDSPQADEQFQKDFLDNYINVKSELDPVKSIFGNLTPNPLIFIYPDDDESTNLVNDPKYAESIRLWTNLIQTTYQETLIDYDILRTGIYGVMHFMQAAKKHRSAVLEYIENSTGWRDVFSYKSVYREAAYDADECVRRLYNRLSTGDQKALSFQVPMKLVK